MASRRSDIGPLGTQREEESSFPALSLNPETADLGEFQTASPGAPAWESYWNTDPGGGFNPTKGFLANIWDMARDPVYFMSGADQNAFEKTAALAYNSFLSTVSARYLEGRHLTEPENKTLQSFAQALGTMAGFAAMLSGPTTLLNFLKVPKALHTVVTGGVYGFGKKTGYGWDGFLSHDDIAARFKGAVMDGGMFAGFHLGSKAMGVALSKALPKTVAKAPAFMGAVQHGTPFGAFEAGMTAYEGGDVKEALARGLGGFMGGGAFGALGGRRGGKAVEGMREQVDALREAGGEGKRAPQLGPEPTALQPDLIPEYIREAARQFAPRSDMDAGGGRFVGPKQPPPPPPEFVGPPLSEHARKFIGPQRQPEQHGPPRPAFSRDTDFQGPPRPRNAVEGPPHVSRYEFTEAEGYDVAAGEASEWRGMALDLLSKHKQSKRGQKQAFVKSLMRARRDLYKEVRKHAGLQGRAGELVNEMFREEYEALDKIGEFEQHKKDFAKEFKATGIPEPVVREGVGERVERQTGGDIRRPAGEIEGESINTLSEYKTKRKERSAQPTESEPVSRGTTRTGEVPGLRATFTEYLEALEAQDLVKQKQLRNALLFDLERQGIEVRGDETVAELDRLLDNVPDVVKDEPVELEKQEIPTGKETKRMKQARALADGRTFFIDGEEYSLEPASITDSSLRLTGAAGESTLVENYEITGRGRKQAITGDGVEAVPARPPGSIQVREAGKRTRVPGKVEEGEAKAAKVTEKVGAAPEGRSTEKTIEDMYQEDLKSDTTEAKQRLAKVKQRGRTLLQENKALEPKRAAELAKDAIYAERAESTRREDADTVSLERDRIAKLEAGVEGLEQQRKDAEEQRRIREQPDEVTETEAEVLGARETGRSAVSEYEAETRTKTQKKKTSKAMKTPVINELVRKIQENPGDGTNSDQLYKELQRLGYKGQELTDMYGDLLSPDTKPHSGVQPGELSGIERPSDATGAVETGIGQDALTESLSMGGREGDRALVASELPVAEGRTSGIYADPSLRPGGEAPTIGKREIVSQDITQAKRGQVWRDPATGELYLNVFQTRMQKDGKTWIPEPNAYDSTAGSGAESGAWLGIHINPDGTLGSRGVRAIKADNMRTWDNLGRQSPEMESRILENVSDEYSRAMHRQQGVGKVGSTGKAKRAAGRGQRIGVKQTQRQAASALKAWQAEAYKADSLNALNRIRAEVGLDALAELPKAHDRRMLDEKEMARAFGIKPDGTLYAGGIERLGRDATGKTIWSDPASRTPMETGIEDLRTTLDLQGRGGERPVGRFAESPRETREFSRIPEETRDPRTIGEEFTPEQILENLLDYDTWYEKQVGKKKEQFAEVDREAERETTQQEREQIAEDFNVHERAMYDEMVGEYVDVMTEMGERVSEAAAREVVLEAMVEGKVPPELEAYLKNRC